MRLLVLSDLHDEEQILDYLSNHYSKSSFDAVLICGDLTNGAYSYAKDAIKLFPKTYFIPGNNEPSVVISKLELENGWIHKKNIKVDEFEIAGFGFSNPTPYGTPGELSETDIYNQMSEIKINNRTILICHTPPYGYFDKVKGKNVGSKAVLQIIQEKKPFAVFFGHVHEHSGVEKLGETYLVKVPAAVNGFYCMVHTNYPNLSAKFLAMPSK